MPRISPHASVDPRPSQWNVLLLAKETPHMSAKPLQYWKQIPSLDNMISFYFING